MQRGLNSATQDEGDADGVRDWIVPGQLFADKYRVLRTIGSGSTGAVYLCQHVGLDKLVALKVLHREMEQNSNFVERFKREAQAASRLEHPNSVRVLDFGQDRAGALYIVMEYIQGRDLLRVLDEDGPFSAERAVDVMSQILDALSVAHSLGIVHRDLKPENIVVRKVDVDGVQKEIVTVCDFGIAQLSPIRLSGQSHSEQISVTDVGMVVGTPAYMSPEQARAEAQDARSDVYSAGVVLFQLLTLTVPFTADSPLAVAVMHCSELPPRPSEFIAVNPALEEVCLKALSKQREARYQSAREMKGALKRALHAAPAQENRRLTPLRWPMTRAPLPSSPPPLPRTALPGPASLLPTELPSVNEDLGKGVRFRISLAQVTVGLALLCTIGIPMLVRSISSTPALSPSEHVVQPAAPASASQTLGAPAEEDRLSSWGGSPAIPVLGQDSVNLGLARPRAELPAANKRRDTESARRSAAGIVDSESARRSKPNPQPTEPSAEPRVTARAAKSEPRASATPEPATLPDHAPVDLSAKLGPEDFALPSAPEKKRSVQPEPVAAQPTAAKDAPRSKRASEPAVVAPPALDPNRASVGVGAIITRSAVSKASVRGALNLDSITDCYRAGLRNAGAPVTPVTGQLELATNMTGAISSASIAAPALSDGVRRCIEQVVRRGRVREVDTGAAQASVTLQFQPR